MRKRFYLFVILCSLGLCACGTKKPKENFTLAEYSSGEIQQTPIIENQDEEISDQNELVLELDASYERKDYDFLFQYPSQWTIKEDSWSSATETKESDPEKTVNLLINEEEKIVIFDSHSHDGGLFYLVSGEEEEIINILGIKGVMITETVEAEAEDSKMRILAYYEEGYEEGIGMGGSYGACAIVGKETYEQYKELIVELFESIHMRQP